MMKNNVKRVVSEATKGNKKKVMKVVGAASIVAAVTLICYGTYKKLSNKCNCDEECEPEKLTDEEIKRAIGYVQSDPYSVHVLKGFGIKPECITIEDVIVNDGKSLILEQDGICICITTDNPETFKVQIYRDPLYDFIVAQ